MSIIFKTLKKLRSQQLEKGKEAERLKKQRKAFTFKAMIASSRLVLFLIFFVVISGIVALFLAEQLGEKKTTVSPAIRKKVEIKKEIPAEALRKGETPAQKKSVPAEEGSPVPPPPETIPVEKAKPEIPARPSGNDTGTQPEKTVAQAPPQVEEQLAQNEKTVHEEPPESAVSFPERTPVSETREAKLHMPEKGPSESKEVEVVAQFPPPGVAARATEKKDEKEDRIPEKQLPSSVSEPSQDDLYRVQVEKNTKIEKLVKEIVQSIETNGGQYRTNSLIRRLASLKEKNDSYVLKLRAYDHMRRGDLDAASTLLKTVLGKDRDDREAGINMAIIEIKKGELEGAKKRLYRLRDTYPHDKVIPDLLDKLE